MRKIIIANWKQNPGKFIQAKKIAGDIKKLTQKLTADVVICPPAPFFPAVSDSKRFFLGAQDVSTQKEGAHTGEVSAFQLRSVGVSFAIIGHSERRALGETSEIVAQKTVAALKAKIATVLCIGEKERHNDGTHWGVISRELHASLAGVPRAFVKDLIVAYEPLWAIGAKSAMKTEDIAESVIFIKKVLAEIYGTKAAHSVRILYGGSVDASNAVEIAGAGVAGFLVGRASLSPKAFAKIAESLK